MDIFDIIGPVMVGPSSSHTAGAVRIGYISQRLMGEQISKAEILLYGSFLDTGKGQRHRWPAQRPWLWRGGTAGACRTAPSAAAARESPGPGPRGRPAQSRPTAPESAWGIVPN